MTSPKDLELSPTYGLNPAIPKCFFCLHDKAEVVLAGRIRTEVSDDAEAPHGACWDKEPCSTCKELMRRGVMLIGADEERSGNDLTNPYRTGNVTVVTDAAYKRMFTDHEPIETRVAFVSHRAWLALGLPVSEGREPTGPAAHLLKRPRPD